MSASFELRDIRRQDGPAIVALNNAAIPNVNALEEAALYNLVDMAAHARVAVDGDAVIGLMLALAPGAPYESLNYRWFDSRYASFLYVDRIVVAESGRGRGIGRRLYDDLSAVAVGRAQHLACEVNESPPNPGSMRFHEGLGFQVVGRQETEGGAKRVALMLKDI